MRGSGQYPRDLMLSYNNDLIHQRGRGIGSIFSSIYRTVMPLVKRAIGTGSKLLKSKAGQAVTKSVKKRAMKAGLNVVQDALHGENVIDSAKREIKSAGGAVLGDMLMGAKKRKNPPTKRRGVRTGKRRKDIFQR